MSNVLPKERINTAWKSFRARFIIVSAFALLILAAVAAGSLLPTYAALRADETDTLSLASGDGTREKRAELARAANLLAHISPYISATSSPLSALEKALAPLPSGVRIERMTVTPAERGIITISGLAKSREAINAYKDALLKSGDFKTVTIPVDALVGTAGGKFTITLTGTF